MPRSLFWLSLLAMLWAPAVASAQVGGSKMHLGAGLVLDFGGEAELERAAAAGDYDLDATPGIRGHLDYAVHRYVSIGGMVRMSWWEPDWIGSIDRSFLLDFGPRVIGHYDWRDFRFYVGLSMGPTISAIDDDGFGVDNPGVGFTMSLTLAGAEWWFSRRVGLFTELGWVGHWFEHDREVLDEDVEFDLAQGLFELGIVFGV